MRYGFRTWNMLCRCGHQAAQHWHSGCSRNPGPKPFQTQGCGHCDCKKFVRKNKREKPDAP